jgi:vitamin B12/bleomycin/antimicrobial peptide transport system ATP-binding/permease protein
LYQLIRGECSQCTVVSVTHRPAVEQHHDKHLTLVGEGGRWLLRPVEKERAPV